MTMATRNRTLPLMETGSAVVLDEVDREIRIRSDRQRLRAIYEDEASKLATGFASMTEATRGIVANGDDEATDRLITAIDDGEV